MATRKNEDQERLIDRDLTAMAREGKLPAAHGVDTAVTEVLGLLARGGKHPLLAGEPGVGKSALVQEVARRIAEGRVDGELAQARLVEVSVANILARSTQRQAAESFEELLIHLGRHPCPIVYIRDLPVALGGPLAPVAVRALRTGGLRFIFETEPKRVQELLRADEALAERLHLLPLQEPPLDKARWIVGRVAEELERELRLPIDPAACDLALRLSAKFLLAQHMPRKAIELLKETAAEAAGVARDHVGPEDVLTRFCAATRLPRFVVDDAMPLDLEETERFFGERLLGQTDAVAAVLRSVALLKAGLNDPRRPLGVFLFAGPTGVGKTQLAKLLAEYLFGSSDRLVRLNMADYPNDGDESVPFGASWAPALETRRGELSALLDGKVFTVLLLDEFEKAARSVHDRFLQLFDEGTFVNGAGEAVSCNNTLIVATSNVGSEVYREAGLGFAAHKRAEEQVSEVDRRIAEAFRPEFLNRFDAICHFRPLSRVDIRKIAQREVGRVLEREGIRARALDVEVTPEVVDRLVERGYSPQFGARYLQREIEKTLTAALAVEIARRPLPPGTPVRVEARPGGRVVAVAEPVPPPREVTAQLLLPTPKAAAVKRRLDRKSLLIEMDRLVGRARALAASTGRPELEVRRAALLAETQAPNLWDDPLHAADVIRAFRTVEAQLGELDRLEAACLFGRRLVREAKNEMQLGSAAKQVEEVAREVQMAEALRASGATPLDNEALVDICASDTSELQNVWVQELATMYLGWAQRRGYEATAVAEADAPARVVVRIAGPGAYGFLAGETGLHRRLEDEKRQRAYVRVHRGGPLEDLERELLVLEGRPVKSREGEYLQRVRNEVTAKDEATGRVLTLIGAGELDELKGIAARVVAGQGASTDEARRYFLGRGARVEDPRTGAGTPRVKDVMRGELDVFIAAWISRAPPESSPPLP
ncbi:PCRF domain-containing protein [Corallococcus exercitus]|uniref:AAA domain-containing protein n=1 Tax=Corallococcus exercitus TaxID=2316736 RepID=A0A3A8IBY3_9BACT|nr:AAA family ATPase [Corallococcus exercitus]NOK33968.1 AAA domain-containing protein [Corallococcus exercitus]RKG80989.1 PCRF domain-containing protein [Corallococcus exercitus]